MKKFSNRREWRSQRESLDEKRRLPTPQLSFLPFLRGVTEDTYTDQRKRIRDEWSKKSNKDYNLIKDLMDDTYPMRRREILTKNL